MTKRRIALAVQGRTRERPPRDDTGETAPRVHLFDERFSTRYDESIVDSRPTRGLLAVAPGWARLAVEMRRRSDHYDAIVTWGERLSLTLMALDRVAPGGKPHIALMYWFSRANARIPLRAFGERAKAIITWSTVQRSYAIEELGVAPAKLYLVRHFVDQRFWSPRTATEDTICAAGAESRDYATLVAALKGTGIPCHVATDHVRVDRFGVARRLDLGAIFAAADANVTVGRKPHSELRELYARSRFVVVPLFPSDTDNGVNVLLEAMAMGKPVICSRTRGQVDVIQEGVTGLFVPVGDPEALRAAILALWHDPERCARMGLAGRAFVERFHPLERFCDDVMQAVDAALDGRSACEDGSVAAQSNAISSVAAR